MRERPELQTVGDLIRQLSIYDKDCEVEFSGLDFYRFKMRGEQLFIEFNQQVYRTREGKVVVENFE